MKLVSATTGAKQPIFEVPDDAPPGTLVWAFRNTGFSSQRFGPCEVCEQHCAEVYHRSAALTQEDGTVKRTSRVPLHTQTHSPDGSAWGHEACLRRTIHPPPPQEP